MFIVTNHSKHAVTRAGITFEPGQSKPVALSAVKLAQINHVAFLDAAPVSTTEKAVATTATKKGE